MRTSRLWLIAVCAAAALVPAYAGANPRAELQKQYDKMANAMVARDVKGMLAGLSKDFRMTMANGQRMNRQQAEQALQMNAAMIPAGGKATNKIDTITVKGNSATVVGTGTFEASVPGPDGKPGRMKIVSRSRDVWKKTGSTWLMVSSTELSQQITLNGKPFNPAMMGQPGAPAPR